MYITTSSTGIYFLFLTLPSDLPTNTPVQDNKQYADSYITCFRETFDNLLGSSGEEVILKPAAEVYHAARWFLFVCKKETDSNRLELLCRYLLQSLESTSKTFSYIGLVLSREHAVPWVAHIKQLLRKCCQLLETLSPEYPADMKSMLIYLHTLISFTGTKTWQLLNNSKTEVVRAGMNIICNTIVEFLVKEGLLLSLKVTKLFLILQSTSSYIRTLK